MRILVIEDSQANRELVQELRGSWDSSELVVVSPLKRALEALSGEVFDCVVVNCQLSDNLVDALLSAAGVTPTVFVLSDDCSPQGSSPIGSSLISSSLIGKGAEDYLATSELGTGALARVVSHAIERRQFRAGLERDIERLAALVRIDPLTECLNRRAVEADMARILRRDKRDGVMSSAIIFDVDNFKAINDQFGHAAGDLVLRELAAILRREARPGDLLARLGGDEFLLVLPGVDDKTAFKVAERLRMAVTTSVIKTGGDSIDEVHVSVSVAVGRIPADVGSATDVFRHLDAALRASKEGGKNRVSLVSARRSSQDQAFVTMLEGAGLVVALQPIVSPRDGRMLRQELFARWPNSPFPNPAALFAKASELGELGRLDRHCLAIAMTRARKEKKGHFHLNILASTLTHMAESELQELLAHDDDLTITLELSENQVLVRPERLFRSVAVLRELGVRIAIDDVGLGDSSLEGLVTLHPDEIKVDRRWVSGIAESVEKQTGFRMLVELAKVIGALVIAEGVEDPADAAAIADLDCDLAQGYFFGRPKLATELPD